MSFSVINGRRFLSAFGFMLLLSLVSSCATLPPSGRFVRLKESLSQEKILKRYKISKDKFAALNPDLTDPVPEGSLIYIPENEKRGWADHHFEDKVAQGWKWQEWGKSRDGRFIWPISESSPQITSYFGEHRRRPRGRQRHEGIDIKAALGTPIVSVEKGRVIYSGRLSGYGKTVIVEHPNGYKSLYAHNQVNLVRKGQRVDRGDRIAKVGRTGRVTGAHLHFEVRRGKKPVNPLSYLPKY
jgi:murein DD-endopeptidase MepM/ murein hydrolase activator NlpD